MVYSTAHTANADVARTGLLLSCWILDVEIKNTRLLKIFKQHGRNKANIRIMLFPDFFFFFNDFFNNCITTPQIYSAVFSSDGTTAENHRSAANNKSVPPEIIHGWNFAAQYIRQSTVLKNCRSSAWNMPNRKPIPDLPEA